MNMTCARRDTVVPYGLMIFFFLKPIHSSIFAPVFTWVTAFVEVICCPVAGDEWGEILALIDG